MDKNKWKYLFRLPLLFLAFDIDVYCFLLSTPSPYLLASTMFTSSLFYFSSMNFAGRQKAVEHTMFAHDII